MENEKIEIEVLGSGNNKLGIVFIGEAPGAEEIEKGQPFQGVAGGKLDELLNGIKVKRDDVYITNVVKIRPTKKSKKGNVINRPPKKDEIEKYRPFLENELKEKKPKLIVTLGNKALQHFCQGAKIGDKHGEPFKYKEWTILPLYHPSPLNFNNLKTLEEDFQKIKEYL